MFFLINFITIVLLGVSASYERPLTWVLDSDAPAEEAAVAGQIVGRICGKVPDIVYRGAMWDLHPFGGDRGDDVLVCRVTDLEIRHRYDTGRHSRVNLHVILRDVDFEILAVVTDEAPYWIERRMSEPDIKEQSQLVFSSAAPLNGVIPKSTVGEVISVLWQWRPDPAQYGQIILRPRHVTHQNPERSTAGGTEPMYLPEIRWVVESHGAQHCSGSGRPKAGDGTMVQKTRGIWHTGELSLVDDATCAFITGLCLP